MSDHFDGKHFFFPGAPKDKGLLDLLHWRWTAQTKPWPAWVANAARPVLPSSLRRDEIAVTFINHATFLLQLDGVNILTDPVFSQRASPFPWIGPRRVRAPGLALKDLPPIHAVLVSHNHYDHMDVPSLRKLDARFSPLFVTTLGNKTYLRTKHLRNVIELDWWQSHQTAEGLQFTLTPSRHFSARGLFDRNKTLWGSFVIVAGQKQLFFAADSGYGPHFREIGERFGGFDLAFLPIGAYEPRWFMGAIHMDPAQALQAHFDARAKRSIAMHFGTFQLTDEGIDDPVNELRVQLRERGVAAENFQVLEVGQTKVFDI